MSPEGVARLTGWQPLFVLQSIKMLEPLSCDYGNARSLSFPSAPLGISLVVETSIQT